MNNYKLIFIAYTFIILLLFRPYIVGDVIAPYRLTKEIAFTDSDVKYPYIENKKFGDFPKSYIPDIFGHFNGPRSGWLTLWTNKNELGRPVHHLAGFSPAYFPSWILASITSDALHFITSLSLLTCFFTGIFFILFCREMQFVPLSGLITGTALATSPFLMYWLTFPMFLAVRCWSACALWAITRLAKKMDLLAWSALAFSAYSLLMTARLQAVVFHAYLLGAYGLCLAYHKIKQSGLAAFVSLIALTASALVVGAGLALPMYRDLAIVASESARVAPAPSFFTAVLPKISSLTEALIFFTLRTVPELFGNPISPSFPFDYNGLSVTLPVIFFAIIGVFTAFKNTWGWWLAIGIFCMLSFIHPLYVLGVKYLGFNLSRSNPLSSLLLPVSVIAAFGVDAFTKCNDQKKRMKMTIVATTCCLLAIAVGLLCGLSQNISIRWGMVLAMLLMLGLLAAQYNKPKPLLLVSALAIVLVTTSYPLMLRQDPEHIALSSPLVKEVSKNLPEGSRFAVASPGISALPPNLNMILGLASLHSYNSLSSRRYHSLINALGGTMSIYGRRNGSIAPDYSSTMFWMSNISLMLSRVTLEHQNLQYLGMESGVHLHRVLSRMGESLQVTLPELDMSAEAFEIGDPRNLTMDSPRKLLDEGDVLEFEVTPGMPSLFILSQKFHRAWQAKALTRQGWRSAHTAEINGVFQGVIVPTAAERIRLDFKPFVRYAWIAHVFWILLLAFMGFRAWQSRLALGRQKEYEK